MMSYSDEFFAAQYDALVHGRGWYALAEWSVVSLTGNDRQKFLHNMCTNEINKLAVGQGSEAFLTDVKGKIVAHVFVLLRADRITLLTVPGQAATIIAHLDRYIIREDVQLRDDTREESWLVLAGAGADSLVPLTLESAWENVECNLAGATTTIARFPLRSTSAYLLGTSLGQSVNLVTGLDSATQCGAEAWNALRAEGGMPLFSIDFNHANLPQEVARNAEAISFTKGCYLGQETVARLDALGHVNKQLVSLKFDASAMPAPGIELRHGGEFAGTATSVAWSPRLQSPVALGMVRRGSNSVGTRLDSDSGPLEVIPTPAIG